MIFFDAKSLKNLSITDLTNLLGRFTSEHVGAVVGSDLSKEALDLFEGRNIQVLNCKDPSREMHALASKYAAEGSVTVVSDNPISLLALDVSEDVAVESVAELFRYDKTNVRSRLGIEPSQVLDFIYLAGSPEVDVKPWAFSSPRNVAQWLRSHGDIYKIMREGDSPAKASPMYKEMAKTAPAVLKQYEAHKKDLERPPTVSIDHSVTINPPEESELTVDSGVDLKTLNSIAALLLKTAKEPLAISLKGDTKTKGRPQEESIPDVVNGAISIDLFSSSYGSKTINLADFRKQKRRLREVLVENLRKREKPAVTDHARGLYGFMGPESFKTDLIFDDVVLMAYSLDNRNRSMSAEQVMQANEIEEGDNFHHRLILASDHFKEVGKKPFYQANYGIYERTDRPFAKVLSKLEFKGMPVNQSLLAKNEKKIRAIGTNLRKEIEKEAGRQVTLDDKDLRKLLFEDLKIKPKQKTATGLAAVNEGALEELKADNPIVEKIEKYRQIQTILSKGFEPLRRHVNRKSGAIHAVFDQAAAATGRLTCSKPALQALPAASDHSDAVREPIEARKKQVLVKGDYAQAEIYVLASLSGCSKLMNLLMSGEDVHRATAAELYEKEPKDVTDNERRSAKAINFMLNYGVTEYGLAESLGVSTKEAGGYINTYFKKFPTVKTYLDSLKQHASEEGNVIAGGRRRIFFEKTSQERRAVAELHRKAVNAPMQGTVADMIKQAMVNIDQKLTSDPGLKNAYVCMQVHDEIIVMTDEADAEKTRKIMLETMGAVNIALPPRVDIELSRNMIKGSNLEQAYSKEINHG